jgi:hypothetical protein
MPELRELGGLVPTVSGYVPDLLRLTTTVQSFVNPDSLPSMTVPDGHWWRILSGNACLVTNATVGNRVPSFAVKDGQNVQVLQIPAPDVTKAGTVAWLVFGPFASAYAQTTVISNNVLSWPIPDVLWPGGYKLQMRVDGSPGIPPDGWSGPVFPSLLIEDYVLGLEGDRPQSLALPTPILV